MKHYKTLKMYKGAHFKATLVLGVTIGSTLSTEYVLKETVKKDTIKVCQ